MILSCSDAIGQVLERYLDSAPAVVALEPDIPKKRDSIAGDYLAGLCPECGANLNAGTCGCEHRWTDARMAALEQLLPKDRKQH